MFAQVTSEVLEYILVGDNDRPMLEIATVGAQGGSEGAHCSSTVVDVVCRCWLVEAQCAMFGLQLYVGRMYAAGPSRLMHG